MPATVGGDCSSCVWDEWKWVQLLLDTDNCIAKCLKKRVLLQRRLSGNSGELRVSGLNISGTHTASLRFL